MEAAKSATLNMGERGSRGQEKAAVRARKMKARAALVNA